MRIIFVLLLITTSFQMFAQKTKPEKIILDTDFGNDCDDAGALAILHQMVYKGEAEILATMYPMNDEWGASAIDAVNTYYGNPNIPIGTYKGSYVYKGKHNDFYNSKLANDFPNDLKTGHNAPDAIALYRKILSSQPDKSVTIIVIGPQRLLADLLLSKPDSISKLDGMQLVKKKVKKLVSMGAEYPKGNEWNIRICPDGAKLVAEQWPTPIVYSGFEIGKPIMTGERLITETPEENPVRVAFETNPMVDEKKNRHSWDETAVLFGVRGLKDYWTMSSGKLQIAEDGKNTWITPGKTHQYLVAKMPIVDMKKVLEDMMVAPPVGRDILKAK
ncbi:MAG: nucleoside hydrolase [Chryseolinea sp.]